MFSKKYYFLLLLLFVCISVGNAAPVVLYNGSGNETPLMESSSRTFPEPPEYYANWGNQDGMIPPYIRLSGQANETRDWSGAFTFANLPVKSSGVSLQMQARATSNASLSIWLETENGNSDIKTYSLSANQTSNLDFDIAPSATLIAADSVSISDYSKTLGGSIYGNVLEIKVGANRHGVHGQ
jgi:hypothetical protein